MQQCVCDPFHFQTRASDKLYHIHRTAEPLIEVTDEREEMYECDRWEEISTTRFIIYICNLNCIGLILRKRCHLFLIFVPIWLTPYKMNGTLNRHYFIDLTLFVWCAKEVLNNVFGSIIKNLINLARINILNFTFTFIEIKISCITGWVTLHQVVSQKYLVFVFISYFFCETVNLWHFPHLKIMVWAFWHHIWGNDFMKILSIYLCS